MKLTTIKKLFGLALILLSTLSSYAQMPEFVLAGRVTDSETQQTLEFAVVKVMKTSDSSIVAGSLTDENGFFKIETLPHGSYMLEISSIGFTKLYTTAFKISAENPRKFFRKLTLKPSANRLKEAKITGQKDFVINSIDRKTYSIENMAINRGSSVSEVLEIIPSVDVDIDGNISLRGSSNLNILIDGKPTLISNSDLHSLLETLPANSIKKIEVITNPSAKYDPDGMAGIINIVTKKNKLEGFFGNVNIGAAYNGRYNAGGMLNIKQGKWSTMISAGVNYRDQFSEGNTYRINYGDTNSILDQFNNGNNIGLGGRVSLSVNYDFSKESSITFSTSQNFRNMERADVINYANSIENTDPFSIFSRSTNTDFGMRFHNYKVDFNRDFKGEDHNLKASLFWNQFDMNITSAFIQGLNEVTPSDWSEIQQRNTTQADIPAYVGQIDYVKPLKNNNILELGAKSINKSGTAFLAAELYDSTSGTWVKEALWSNDYRIDEGIHSAYAVYKQSIKKFGYQVGLRLEKAFTDAYLLESGDTFHNEYFSPFPTVHLSYQLKPGQQLKASYSRRINRPGERAMRPFADYSDPLNIRQGNPFLFPEYINSYEVEYSLRTKKQNISTAAYYKEINGMITRVKTVEDGVATTTFLNLGSGANYGLELIYNANFTRKWRMTFSSNAFRTEIFGGTESELNADGYQVSSKFLTSYRLPYSMTVQLSGRYSTPRILPQGEISAMQWVDFALQKRLMKNKATLNFKITDVFNTREFGFITEDNTFYQDSYRKRESRFYQLSFSYNFGEFKNMQRRRSSSGGSGSGGNEEGVEID